MTCNMADLPSIPELAVGTIVVSVIGIESPVISIEQDGSDMAIHEYEARALYEWLGAALPHLAKLNGRKP